MADKTKNLQLSKPASGAINWGSAMNGNMEKLDRAYDNLSSRITLIQQTLGEMNYIFFIEDEKFAKLDKNNPTQFAVGTINEDGSFKQNRIYTEDEYGTILDFTGFYIYEDYDDAIVDASSPYNDTWDISEIMVKVSYIEDNTRQVKFIKFPQALGGYYVPDATYENGCTYIDFIKTLPLQAGDKYTVKIPPGNVEATWANVPLSEFTPVSGYLYKYQLHLLSPSSTLPPSVDVKFSISNTNNTLTQTFFVDHWFTYENGENYIYLQFDAAPPRDRMTFSYIQYILNGEDVDAKVQIICV